MPWLAWFLFSWHSTELEITHKEAHANLPGLHSPIKTIILCTVQIMCQVTETKDTLTAKRLLSSGDLCSKLPCIFGSILLIDQPTALSVCTINPSSFSGLNDEFIAPLLFPAISVSKYSAYYTCGYVASVLVILENNIYMGWFIDLLEINTYTKWWILCFWLLIQMKIFAFEQVLYIYRKRRVIILLRHTRIGDQNYIIFFLFEKFYPLCFD